MPCIDGVCGNVEILQACANYHAFDAGRRRFIPHIFRYIPGKCAMWCAELTTIYRFISTVC